MHQHQHKNDLAHARRRLGLSRKTVATLIQRSVDAVERYEKGMALPSLEMALKLEIIYRMPVAFLFGQLYKELHKSLRDQECVLTRRPGHVMEDAL